MKKVLLVVLAAIFASCVSMAVDYPKMKIDLATVYDAKSAPAQGAQRFKEIIERESGGNIEINLFTNGSLGTEKDNFNMLATDEIYLVVGGIQPIDMFAPAYMFLSAPYVITSWAHLDAVMKSKIGKNLAAELDKNNIHALAINYRGIRETTANKPIHTPADIQGLKLRLAEVTSWVAFWKGAGALTTPVSLPELYGALQTNVVEASEGPYEQFATNKLYEVQKYVINTHHIYEPTWLYISTSFFNAQNSETKALFEKAAKEGMAYANSLADELAEKFLKEMKDHGSIVIDPDVAAFQKAAEPILEDLFKSIWNVTTLKEVRSMK